MVADPPPPDADAAHARVVIEQFRAAGRPADPGGLMPPSHAERRSLAEALGRVGVEAFNASDLDLARDAFWLLFVTRLAVVKDHPDSRADIRDFASAEDLFAQVMLADGKLEEAEQLLSEALRYRRGLAEDDPADAHAAYLLGLALWHMARLERAKGRSAEAKDWSTQADIQLTRVDETWPGISFVTALLDEIRSGAE